MQETVNFVKKFESTVKVCWDMPALGEFGGEMASYGQLAREIEVLRLICNGLGMRRGDKIAINARNSYQWALVFVAATALGYTSVLILHGSTSEQVQQIVDKADCRILFTERQTFSGMNFESMPGLVGVVDTRKMDLLAARGSRVALYTLREKLFHASHKHGYKAEDVSYQERPMDDLCCIIYTSGSTGNPKGVMLTGQNFQNYVERIPQMFNMQRGETHINMLPFAHLFGLAYDILAPLCLGQSVSILTQAPIPSTLKKVLNQVRPSVLFAVPLVLNKFVNSIIGNDLRSDEFRSWLNGESSGVDYGVILRDKLNEAMGGNVKVIMSAGAASSLELEDILVTKLGIPYVTGYGLTECAPLITLSRTETYLRGSCGEVLPDVQLRIDSPDPANVPGELIVSSKFVFAGYYRNEEANRHAFTADGWFRTGDVGTRDAQGRVVLSGRCKNMLLTSNGQNVYPEEIEAILAGMPFVGECLIVQKGETFGALIVPDKDGEGLSEEDMKIVMSQNITMLNGRIPTYSKINWYKIEPEGFEKTPKGSIKRFIYQERENS